MENVPGTPPQAQQGQNLSLDLLGIIDRRRGWLVFSCLLGLAIGAAYYLLTARKYESKAELLLMQNDSGVMASGTGSSERNVSEELLATHMKLLQSDRIIAAALDNHELRDLPSITEMLDADKSEVDYVIENLYVTSGGSGRARNAHVLNIAFRHTSASDAERVMKAIVHEYQQFVKSKFQDINIEAAELISAARKELEKEIDELEKQYREFRINSPLLSRGTSGTDIFTARYEELAAENSQLAIQQDEAKARLDLVKTTLEEYSKSGVHNLQKLALIDDRNAERLGILVTVERGKAETAAFQSLQPERMAGATAEYSSLLTMRSRLQQITEDFGPEHPEVRALKKQISETEEFLEKRAKTLFVSDDEAELKPDDVMTAYVSMLEHDLRALEQRSKDIERQMKIAEKQAKELVSFQLQDESLVRERSRHEDLYNVVIERLRNINMQRDSASLIQEQLREPELGKKVEPKGTIAAVIAMFSAALIGAVGAIAAELRDRNIRDPKEIEGILDSRVLAHLPNYDKDPSVRQIKHKAKKARGPISPTILTHYAINSRPSEGFRALRTQVMFGLNGDHKTIAVTSAEQGAGKSMIASNLAVSIASSGLEVLLVDCDMRLPQVHSLFGVENKLGLADTLNGNGEPLEKVVPSSISNLALLTAGVPTKNPAELLSHPTFRSLLAEAKERFAYVILDCPPVLPVSDPAIITPLADGVLFVTVADNTSRPKTNRVKAILDGVKARLIGVVVNRSDSSSRKYGYEAYGYESASSADRYFSGTQTTSPK